MDKKNYAVYAKKCTYMESGLEKICWKDKVTNISIRETVNQRVTIVDEIKRQKLQLFGHIYRMKDN